MFLYFSKMMYRYYSHLGFLPIKHNEEGKYINSKIFNNIPYFIKNLIRVNCLQDGFVMYNDKAIIWKQEVITPITCFMIPVYLCQNNKPVINSTTGDMISKYCMFSKNKMDALYITESIQA